MAPDSWKLVYANVLKQVAAGQITQARVDDAAQRILRVKVMAGLFNKRAAQGRVSAGQLGDHGLGRAPRACAAGSARVPGAVEKQPARAAARPARQSWSSDPEPTTSGCKAAAGRSTGRAPQHQRRLSGRPLHTRRHRGPWCRRRAARSRPAWRHRRRAGRGDCCVRRKALRRVPGRSGNAGVSRRRTRPISNAARLHAANIPVISLFIPGDRCGSTARSICRMRSLQRLAARAVEGGAGGGRALQAAARRHCYDFTGRLELSRGRQPRCRSASSPTRPCTAPCSRRGFRAIARRDQRIWDRLPEDRPDSQCDTAEKRHAVSCRPCHCSVVRFT